MKQDFAIDVVINNIEEAVKPYPKAAMFELAEWGYTSAFEQLITYTLSFRSYEISLLVEGKLFLEQTAVTLPTTIHHLSLFSKQR